MSNLQCCCQNKNSHCISYNHMYMKMFKDILRIEWVNIEPDLQERACHFHFNLVY